MNGNALMSLADCFAAIAGLGLLPNLVGTLASLGFARGRPRSAACRVPVSILKPMCGDEPLLEQALETFCRLDYPDYQLVLGVQNPNDPALDVAERVRRRWPDVDITLVVDPALHGANRKVSNLVNMLGAARHDLLVFSDSDLHVPADYLRSITDTLAQPGVGLVTTLTVGRPGGRSVASALGCLQIGQCFLPSVLLSRLLGRQDCLGTTMALHRRTLRQAGGLPALVNHLADDHVLGRRVRALGLSVALAPVIPATTVPEAALPELWAHELRWGRTIGALEPLLFLVSALQYPLFWAALSVLLSGGRQDLLLTFMLVWAVRAAGLQGMVYAIRRTPGAHSLRQTAWLLPFRDVLSVAVVVASLCGNRVLWRGHFMRADNGVGRAAPAPSERAVSMTVAAGALVRLGEERPR